MSKSVSRVSIDGTLPRGSFWRPKIDGFLDRFWNGLAESFELVRTFLADLSTIREPKDTIILSDLEKEFGISTSLNLTEDIRRQQLSAKKYRPPGNGASDDLQEALDLAGFNLLVHLNSPAVDPAIFLSQVFGATLGNDAAHLGRVDAFFSKFGGELIVNGPIISQFPGITFQIGGIFSMGNSGAILGGYLTVETIVREYDIPVDPDDWPLVFFVGGPAIRDGITGELLEIELADVPSERRTELIRIIIQIKGLHSWCGLIVNFT